MSSNSIDPQCAWDEFVPSAETPWDLHAAAHLFRRAGFGATRQELNSAVEQSPGAVVDRLMQVDSVPDAYRQQSDVLAAAAMAGNGAESLPGWWAHRMLTTPVPLLEKMTLLWHGHFATSVEKVQDAHLMLAQNRILRSHALGDFGQLLLEIARDPAMLVYLDSATNRKAHPNENFAREIMELFCLGEGQYSEQDIRELARCFTGWEVKRRRFRINRYQHDRGTKSIFGESGKFGGEDGVRIVVSQPAAPEFVVRKLFHFFVRDEPVADRELIAPLAKELRDNGMQIAPTVRRILAGRLFFSEESRGRKIRSPVELAVGFLRSLEGSANAYELAMAMKRLGQGLFAPPSVKGWDGGRTWINSSTLLGRSNLIRHLLDSDKSRFGRQPLPDYLRAQDVRTAGELIDFFETGLFAVPIPAAARERVASLAAQNPLSDEDTTLIIHTLSTLPEFQLC